VAARTHHRIVKASPDRAEKFGRVIAAVVPLNCQVRPSFPARLLFGQAVQLPSLPAPELSLIVPTMVVSSACQRTRLLRMSTQPSLVAWSGSDQMFVSPSSSCCVCGFQVTPSK